jgi:hypothetical protein
VSDIQDAETGDIYVDGDGKLWRILSVVHEPTIEAEEVEGTLYDPNAPIVQGSSMGASAVNSYQSIVHRASIQKAKRKAPTCADVWSGFVRIWGRK